MKLIHEFTFGNKKILSDEEVDKMVSEVLEDEDCFSRATGDTRIFRTKEEDGHIRIIIARGYTERIYDPKAGE